MTPTQNRPPIASLIRSENRTHASQRGETDPAQTAHLAKTKWLTLSTLRYRYTHDPPATFPRTWDVASRTTRTSAGGDAVVVFARFNAADERVLLVKQYRPPVDAVSLELPAGLIDAGETPSQAGLRELREETGMVGRVVRVHEAASLSPGMSSETVFLAEVEIEGRGGGLMCDPGENIEVVSVPIDRFEEAVQHMARTEGVVVMHAVTTLGMGLRLGAELGR